MLASAPYAISGGLTNVTSYFSPNIGFAMSNPVDVYQDLDQARIWGSSVRAWPTAGTRQIRTEVIQAHKGWVANLAIASIILIVASLMPPIIRHFLTRNLEVLMNISSLATRKKLYIPLPSSETSLDASDRARLLEDYKLCFGDVDESAEVGILAIDALDTERSNTARVRKNRVYE